jgi:hypothetical protein
MTMNIRAKPNLYARTAGAIYLAVIVFGGFSEGFVTSKIIVGGNAAATAHNMLALSPLWSFSLAGNLIVPVIAVAQLWIEYLLLRPVSRSLALLFVLMNAVSLAVEAVSKIFQILPMAILTDHGLSGAFSTAQIYSLMDLSLKVHEISFDITLIFFGFACIIAGYLYYKSKFVPKAIGLLLQLAGGCYVVASFAALFAPRVSDAITPFILLPPFVGEAATCLWLLVKGVNVATWRTQCALRVLR